MASKFPLQIMVVDDVDLNLKLAKEMLKGQGFNKRFVSTARTGAEIVDVVCTQGKKVDLILMDCQMPVMDGLAATRAIRAHFAKAREDTELRCSKSASSQPTSASVTDGLIELPVIIALTANVMIQQVYAAAGITQTQRSGNTTGKIHTNCTSQQ